MTQPDYPDCSRWFRRLPVFPTPIFLTPVFLAIALCLALSPQIASAQSWSLGLTAYDADEHGPQPELLIERQFRPFTNLGKWSLAPAIGARVSTDTGTWVGAGLVGTRDFGDGKWRIDAGVMPGYYDPGSDGTDLGSDLEFRTFLSLGREVSDRLYVALEVEHMSNAGLADRNPGDNRLLLNIMRLDRK